MNKIWKCILYCTAIILVLAALIYCVPSRTRVDVTLNAVKLDEDGTPIGTAKIHIEGYMLDYLLQDDRMELEIDPIENFDRISLRGVNGNKQQDVIDRFGKEYFGMDYLSVRFYGWDTFSESTASGLIYFTEEFECFAFQCKSFQQSPVYYVASVSGDYTTDELISFFNGLVPG